MARRNMILAAGLLLQLVWLGVRAFQAPPPSASAARGPLLAELVPAAVLRLEIGSGSDSEKPLVVEREAEASTWRVPDLFDYRADGDKVDGALRVLAGLEIASVVSSTAHHHVEFKVAESEFEKRIRLAGAGEPVELLFGSSGPAGTVHVRRAGEDAIYAVRGYSSWRFGEDAEDWIEKVYFSAPRERIAHVAITVANDQAQKTTSFSLERAGEEGWVLLGAGEARSPADGDKVDSLLRGMSRVLLSKLVGRIDDEEVAFGVPVAELALGLAAPRYATEPAAQASEESEKGGGRLEGVGDAEGAGEEAAASSPTASDDTAAVASEETRILRVALAPGESDRYWLHADGSEFVAEVARWTIRELLDAVVQDFQAPELEAEAGEESADSAESEEHEISRDDGGEAN